MFIVYKSNSLNRLLLKAYHIIQKKPLSNIFEKEIFVHDNKILFQYLNIFFAEKTGISANFKLYHPNYFIWKLFKIILSKKKLKNTFTHAMIAWEIMKILDNKNFLEYYNEKLDNIQKFKFSFLMANIFEQYIVYRPNWINEWEKEQNISITDPMAKWQKKLWMKITSNIKKIYPFSCHFAKLFYSIQALIQEKKIKKKYLPNRCFIISDLTLNPSYIKILKKISTYINIYFLYITPCKNNIFYLIKDNKVSLHEKIEKKNMFHNSLIMLWIQYEKIYSLYIIQSKKIKKINCFKKNKNDNLLNNIKNDFLEGNKLKKKDY
ncbi:exodeoxyribonuclease V subunit gamma [Buchnera aphidicola]|uniref:exodeoxyribonuclease V subunit gamma n=1 Tax=Buchnera aphidicola TaxID=9 RepID=UPI00030B693E|nr:exodeoxyribonuclease V subunit gamma [Buchnera aphidicola]